jgi:hypothetical protein
MRKFLPLLPLLLTALAPCASYAQDSPIIIDDNGNVPLPLGKPGKPGKKSSKATKSSSSGLTRINYMGGIKSDSGEYLVKADGYQAVCMDTANGQKVYLVNENPWKFTTQPDNAVIHADGQDNQNIHIHLGKNMKASGSNDLLDKTNQLTGAVFGGNLTSATQLSYQPQQMPPQMFIIHYCGSSGCIDPKTNVDQCPNPPQPDASRIKKNQ